MRSQKTYLKKKQKQNPGLLSTLHLDWLLSGDYGFSDQSVHAIFF